MATYTPNFGLCKPEKTDYVSVVEAISNNMDIIDENMKKTAVLLWENGDPSSAVSSTITFTYTGEYKYFVFVFRSGASDTTAQTKIVYALDGGLSFISATMMYTSITEGVLQIGSRLATVSLLTKRITINATCRIANVRETGTTISVANTSCIPLKIYGIPE